jgi:alpha-1,6-mannosyltransferase
MSVAVAVPMSEAAGDSSERHVVDATMFWSPTGGGVRRYLLAKRSVIERSHPTWRHTLFVPGPTEPGVVGCGGVPLPFSGGYRVPLVRRSAARRLAALLPDIVEAGDPYRLAWSVLDAARDQGVPAVCFCHSNLAAFAARVAGADSRRGRWASSLAARYVRRLYAQFDAVLAPSRFMVDELRDAGITHAEHQPLGVDTLVFNPSAHRDDWRRSFGFAPGQRLVLYAGRFAVEKNLTVLCDAVDRMDGHCKLLVIGSGPLVPHGRHVQVLPFERDSRKLAQAMASVDAFAHAGDQETFGLSVLEAMACGTPVVVRKAGGLAELVEGGAGIAVDTDRPDRWAEALAAAFTAPHGAMAKRARDVALSHDWSVVVAAMLRRYERLIHNRAMATLQSHVPSRPAVSPP